MSITPSPSDLESCLPIIRSGLVGFRNVLSYTSSLGLEVISLTSIPPRNWSLIDSGAFSVVWKSDLNTKPGTAVAIKQPKASFTREKAEVEDELRNQGLSSLIQELRILAHPNLKNHPNLPHALGVAFQEEENPPGIKPCLVLDLAVSDLHNHLKNMPADDLDGKEMMRLASHVASGICALHAYGLVHGDIKPKNVFLFLRKGNLTAAVGDLGTCGVSSQITGIIPGTQSFFAPEVYANSPFHNLANQPTRDIYSFGLLVFSMMIRCSREPFPSEEQFNIQHDDSVCIEHLLSQLPSSFSVPELWAVIQSTIKADPAERAQIVDMLESLENTLGEHNQHELVQDLAEMTLLSNPEAPRVNALGQMPLPSYMMSKLLSEYTIAVNSTPSVRLAFTMAAFYSGALGAGIERPWNFIAKLQWLLKAVEMGNFAAVSGIMSDKIMIRILESFGDRIIKIRQPFFTSPSIDHQALLYRLTSFAAMPDVESLNVLVFLGGEIQEEAEHRITRLKCNKNERQQKVRLAIPNLSAFEEFNLNRDADLQMKDSDAFDLALSNASEIKMAVYNNNIEKFIALAEDLNLKPGDHRLAYFMALAIFNGSRNVVCYLLDQYGVHPNQSWGDMSHFNDAVVFRRQSIVEIFLARNAIIEPASGNKPSALHLVARDDDPQLPRLLCEHLKSKNGLLGVLKSKTTEGDLVDFTPVYVAMICQSWKVAQVFLDYGADPNDEVAGSRLLDMAVTPKNPAVPLSMVQTLLRKGAETDWPAMHGPSPLRMAIQSSNVLAVLHLLLHSASIEFQDSTTAVEEAESSVVEMQTGPRLNVLNVDGELCSNGWEDCSEACSVILEMVHIALAKSNDWKGKLNDIVIRSSEACKSKLWILDRHSHEATLLVEVNVPS